MLRSRGKKVFLSEQEQDFMAGLVNLLDVMLVFSVGLIIALVLSWNLQHLVFIPVERGKELKELPLIEEGGGQGYQERGKVYQDPETGRLILIEELPAANAAEPITDKGEEVR